MPGSLTENVYVVSFGEKGEGSSIVGIRQTLGAARKVALDFICHRDEFKFERVIFPEPSVSTHDPRAVLIEEWQQECDFVSITMWPTK